MAQDRDDYSDVSGIEVDPVKREELYEAQTECVVNWSTREGWPVGVLHGYSL